MEIGPKLTAMIATASKMSAQNAVMRQFQILDIAPCSVLIINPYFTVLLVDLRDCLRDVPIEIN